MLREKVAKLAKLLFAGATMALCVATINPAVQVQAGMLEENEPNGSPATVNKLPLNTWIRGTIGDYADQDWYEITIPRGNGYSQIEIKPSADNPLNDSAWRIEICDKNRHTLRSYTAGANKDAKIGLVAGKYYIIVKCQYSNIGLDGTYNLMAHYTASKEWELERYFRDKNPRNANIVYLNRRYTGSLYCNDDVDYYRFKLNGTNRVSFKFIVDDSVSDPGVWQINFKEYNSRKELESYRVSANETIVVPKCVGDLMVTIENPYYEAATEQIYHIQASVKTNTIANHPLQQLPQQKPASVRQQFTGRKQKMQQATMYIAAQIPEVDTRESQQ